MDNTDKPVSLLNALRPEEKVLKGEYPGADARLDAVIYYLKSSIQAIEQRKAYVVRPGYWRCKSMAQRNGKDVGGRLEIERQYFATMAPAKAEAMDADEGFKAIARPLIAGEELFVFEPSILGGDRRSSAGKTDQFEPSEKDMVQLKRENPKVFRKIELSSVKPGRDEQFFLTAKGAATLADFSNRDYALWFVQSTSILRKKREYAEMLRDAAGVQHEPLKQMLEPSHVWNVSPRAEITDGEWIDPSLRDPRMPGTEEQRDFVRKALATKDFALVWGPAGAGKTTAICEFIKQAVRLKRKVLMVGSTHVAVDNVLEKFSPARKGSQAAGGDSVIAVRVGRTEKVSAEVRPLLMQNFIRREAQRLKDHLTPLTKSDGPTAGAAGLMLKSLDEDLGADFMERLDGDDAASEDGPVIPPGRGALLKMIMDGANLVGGTTLGILAHPSIQSARDSRAYPEFDYLIVDEASKTTLDEFLVPAMCAKRWIIVGDPYQLAPFCEEAELGAALTTALSQPVVQDEQWLEQAASVSVKREVKAAVEYALMERAVRFKGGDYHLEMQTKRDQAMDRLGAYTAKLPGKPETIINLRDLCEQTFGVALPSVLESLIGERAGMLPPPRSLIRPFGDGLASRLVELKYQFRMAPRIADFCKQHVYGGRLLLTSADLPEKPRLHSMASGQEGRFVVLSAAATAFASLTYQDRERESAVQLALAVWELLQFADWAKRTAQPSAPRYKAYLISTYKNQNNLCKQVVEYLEEHHADRFSGVELEANTVDSCQGHEADLVLLSLVRERQTPFMRSLNRMNVAFTRARSRLVLLGDLPAKTEEAIQKGVNQTLIDELHDYGPSREIAKDLGEAVAIVNLALT